MDTSWQIEILLRQYLQIQDPENLSIPSWEVLKLPDVQARIYENMFNKDHLPHAIPSRYTFRVLKRLVNAIEQAIDDPEEDVGFSLITSHLCFTIVFRSMLY